MRTVGNRQRRTQHGNLPFEPARVGSVVGIETGDEFAAGDPQTVVQTLHKTKVALVREHHHPLVAGGEVTNDVGRPVGGSIVDDHDLEVAERLSEQTLQRGT